MTITKPPTKLKRPKRAAMLDWLVSDDNDLHYGDKENHIAQIYQYAGHGKFYHAIGRLSMYRKERNRMKIVYGYR
jgi:hypothetical protein